MIPFDLSILNTEEYNAVYLTLNQEIFDLFKNEEEFYNYALNAIIQSYRLLENNKVFVISRYIAPQATLSLPRSLPRCVQTPVHALSRLSWSTTCHATFCRSAHRL